MSGQGNKINRSGIAMKIGSIAITGEKKAKNNKTIQKVYIVPIVNYAWMIKPQYN